MTEGRNLRIYYNEWRKTSWRYWAFWFDPREHWRAWKALYQRARRGYADADLWSFDNYLNDLLSKSLRQFAEDARTYPPDITYEEWQNIVRKMAAGFEARQELDWDDLGLKEGSKKRIELEAAMEEGFDLFRQWYGHLWN